MSPISTSLLKNGKKNTNKKHWQRLDDKYKTVGTQMKFKLLSLHLNKNTNKETLQCITYIYVPINSGEIYVGADAAQVVNANRS